LSILDQEKEVALKTTLTPTHPFRSTAAVHRAAPRGQSRANQPSVHVTRNSAWKRIAERLSSWGRSLIAAQATGLPVEAQVGAAQGWWTLAPTVGGPDVLTAEDSTTNRRV
jgi:hypothetical protein